jgi:hypothetical protein
MKLSHFSRLNYNDVVFRGSVPCVGLIVKLKHSCSLDYAAVRENVGSQFLSLAQSVSVGSWGENLRTVAAGRGTKVVLCARLLKISGLCEFDSELVKHKSSTSAVQINSGCIVWLRDPDAVRQ